MQNNLLNEIEQRRKELIHLVQLKGMTNEATVEKSQVLDKLLNEYNKYVNKRA